MEKGAGMTKARYTSLATVGLIACTVFHVWALIWVVREEAGHLVGGASRPLPWAETMGYLLAVLVFNWCAARGESQSYRVSAQALTAVHLGAALACGLLLSLGAEGPAGLLGELWAALGLLQLPLNSIAALEDGNIAAFWWMAVFYGGNLAAMLVYQEKSALNNST